jgi:hypothetical protein
MKTLLERENELADLIAAGEVLAIKTDQAAKEVERLRIERAADEILGRPDTSLLGESMTTSKLLAAALDQQDWCVRRIYRDELTPEQKAEVERCYRKHIRACLAIDVPVEDRYLHELIYDIRRGIHEPESFAMRVGA